MVAPGAARFYSCPLMRALVRIFIRSYQMTISPVLSFLGGPSSGHAVFLPVLRIFLASESKSTAFDAGAFSE